MGDDGDVTDVGAYAWFLWFCRGLVQWAAFAIGGVGTLLIFWFHWLNAADTYGVKVWDENRKKTYWGWMGTLSHKGGGGDQDMQHSEIVR